MSAADVIDWLRDRAIRLSGRRRGVVLVYHRVGDPPGDPERELVPSLGRAEFGLHLDALQRRYTIVPAAEIREAAARRIRGDRYPVAITFDDDLVSHLEDAIPLLAERGLPATFFLCGASAHEPSVFWWEALQHIVDEGSPLVADLVRHLGAPPGSDSRTGEVDLFEIARRIERLSRDERRRVDAMLAGVRPAGWRPLGTHEIAEIARRGFDVGVHTVEHHRLTSLEAKEIHGELVTGRARLTEVGALPVLAYPHGAADDVTATVARSVGISMAFTCEPTAVAPETDPLLLGRLDAACIPPERLTAAIRLIVRGPRPSRVRASTTPSGRAAREDG